jgi:hypothetical protein
MISRRSALFGIAAIGLAAGLGSGHAQRPHRVGVLINGSERNMSPRVEALRAGLRAHG